MTSSACPCEPCEALALYHAWRGALPSRHAPNTARTYRTFVFRFIEDAGVNPRTVEAGAIRRWLDRTYPPQTAAKARQALGDFFRWLVEHGHRADDPIADARPRRYVNGSRIKKGLTPDELVRLLVAWRVKFGRRPALVALAHYYTGCRPGEWIALTASDVSLGDTPEVYVRATKTNTERIVPLSDRAADVFAELCAGRVGRIAGVTIPIYRRQFQVACDLAGIDDPKKRRPYALRHSYATHLMQRGVAMRVVAELLGHANLRHTITYTGHEGDDLRRAVGRLDGPGAGSLREPSPRDFLDRLSRWE